MKKKTTRKRATKTVKPAQERSIREIIASAGNDWATSGISMDAEVFQTHFSMLLASRDSWRCNPYMTKYAEQISSDVFGEHGIMLRSKIKETEDRVVHAPDEKWALIAHEKRINRIRQWAEKKTGRSIESYRAFHLADNLERAKSEHVLRGTATIEVGAPDVYANQRVESWWEDTQRAENIDVRGRRSFNMLRQIMFWGGARDGGHFVRMIKDSRVNKNGFAIQLINDEWCDYFYNVYDTGSGTTIRMGIEYPFTAWGIGQPIAYYFIKRIPRDWQTFARYGGQNSYQLRERVPAEEIIHYARFNDTESTRPAPWGISILGKIRQLDQYEVAEVVAARRQACSTGWLESTVNPEGGMAAVLPDPKTGIPSMPVTPGGLYGLPWGVTYKEGNPTHPNGNFGEFRNGMGKSACAGLPGANYWVIFNEGNMSFSAGRTTRLDTQEVCKGLQRFHIQTAENTIFENGLEMALITGAVPLPISKFSKFNRKAFQGRRWKGIDEAKDAQAAALRIANKLSSRSKECAEEGVDFEDNAMELAEEDMLLEELGLRQETTAQSPSSTGATDSTTNTEAAASGAIQSTALNGAQIASLLQIVGQFTSGIIGAEACNALIAASFPLMPEDEINAIVANLTVSLNDAQDAADAAQESSDNGTLSGNGKHLPAIDKRTRLAIKP